MTKYNGTCPDCKSKAYLGFSKVECSNFACKHYVKPENDESQTASEPQFDFECPSEYPPCDNRDDGYCPDCMDGVDYNDFG